MLIIATLALFFELHLQFFLSLHTGIILKCLLFLVPLTHLLSQRGEKSCPADVLFGGIMALLWSARYLFGSLTEPIVFQKITLQDALKWAIIIFIYEVIGMLFLKISRQPASK